jgi:MYXO-CTERM domain-containing protein
VLGNHLGGDGAYKVFHTASATSPVIDVGQEKHVRLQLRRWLTVKDGVYDQASIIVNGQLVWQNASTDDSDGTLEHRDAEWRFEDIDLSPLVKPDEHTVQVKFELSSHKSHPLGGWNIDDMCIVAWHPVPMMADAGADATDGGDGEPMPSPGCGCELPGQHGGEGAKGAAALLALLGIAARARRRSRATGRRT